MRWVAGRICATALVDRPGSGMAVQKSSVITRSMSMAQNVKPDLPMDVATSMSVLADHFGGMVEATGYATGRTWPSGLAAPSLVTLGGLSPASAQAASAPPATTGRAVGGMATLEAVARNGPLRAFELVRAASAVMQSFHGWAERRTLDEAFAKLNLDRAQPHHVMAAYAYVWAHNMAPWSVSGLPFAGDRRGLNERFAVSLSRYELGHPGTVFLATRGHLPSRDAIQQVWNGVAGTAAAAPRISIVERRSEVHPNLSASSRIARAAAGISANGRWQAHHVIPFAVVAALPDPVQLAIAKSGWTMNSGDNVIALPADAPTYYGAPNSQTLPWHNTNHPAYSRAVAAALVPIAATATTVPPATLLNQIRALDLSFERQLVANRRAYHPRLR